MRVNPLKKISHETIPFDDRGFDGNYISQLQTHRSCS